MCVLITLWFHCCEYGYPVNLIKCHCWCFSSSYQYLDTVTFVFCFAPELPSVSLISDSSVSISVSIILWHFALLIKLQAAWINTVPPSKRDISDIFDTSEIKRSCLKSACNVAGRSNRWVSFFSIIEYKKKAENRFKDVCDSGSHRAFWFVF